MFARRLPFLQGVRRLVSDATGGSEVVFKLEPVETHDLEDAVEKIPRTLKHLLKANHQSHSVVYHDLRFDNHLPHHLVSAYLLGASKDQLLEIYEVEDKVLEDWVASPQEITDTDWQEHLGDKTYQRAYLDFFEDRLAFETNYDWKELLEDALYEGKAPLINGLVGGLGHPLIHLGYAYESQSRAVAMEALTLAAVQHNFLHKYLDNPSYTKAAPFTSTSPLELLKKLEKDARFDGLVSNGISNMEKLFSDHEDLMLEYWNAWQFSEPNKQFEDSQRAAVALLVDTVKPGTHSYDFFIVHILTTSHAVRTMIPLVRRGYQINLVKQWWLLTLAVYVCQGRPAIDESAVGRPDMSGKHWKYVEDLAVNGPWAKDAHYVKAIRSLKEAALTWGDAHEWFLAAAVRFAEDFKGWTGFY